MYIIMSMESNYSTVSMQITVPEGAADSIMQNSKASGYTFRMQFVKRLHFEKNYPSRDMGT